MRRTQLITSMLLTFAAACGSPERDTTRSAPFVSPQVRAKMAERRLADARPDSFTTAADQGRVLGLPTAPVWVVIVSDFQCVDCKRWYDEVFPHLVKEYEATGRIRLAYVNMPRENRLNGMATALAATCAAASGRFWETAERIFATQDIWRSLPDARPYLDSLASAAGVNAPAQQLCTERARGMKLVQADMERATTAGVDSLPTFFIGTHKVVGNAPLATFRSVIESALAGR